MGRRKRNVPCTAIRRRPSTIETVEGPAEKDERPATAGTNKTEIRKNVLLNKLYTDEQRRADMEKLEKRVEYSKGSCETEPHTNGQDQYWWYKYCEELAAGVQRSLDILTNDPDRYYYIMDQRSRKVRGDPVDNPPYHPN
jgi:hypothetical protein